MHALACLQFAFKRVGKRVSVDPLGNLMLRPTYFELSVTHRGASVAHHMTPSYAQSIAAVLKAQVGGGVGGVGWVGGWVGGPACALPLHFCDVAVHCWRRARWVGTPPPLKAQVVGSAGALPLDFGGVAVHCWGRGRVGWVGMLPLPARPALNAQAVLCRCRHYCVLLLI